MLPPEIIQTDPGMSESVASYSLRTAEANCIGVGTLLRLAMPHTSGRNQRGPYVNTKLLMRLSAKNRTAYKLVERALPGINLGTSTLTLFRGLCAQQKLYRPILAWSPQFLWQRRTPYYPLIWHIDAVRVCPVMKAVLQFRCPSCGRLQVYLSEKMVLGTCVSCGAQFDDAPVSQGRDSTKTFLQVGSLEYELWIAEQVRAYIAFRSTKELPEGFSLSETLRWWLDAHGASTLVDASRLFGISASGFSVWLRLGHLPRLRTLLQLCHGMHTGLVGFILRRREGNPTEFDSRQADSNTVKKTRSYRRANPLQLRKRLRQIIDRGEYIDQPLTWISREQLNAGIGTVYRYCRKEALAVAARFKSRRRARVAKRNEAFVQEMKAAAIKVVQLDRVPRHDTLAPFLSRKSWLWRPWAKRALSEIRVEMGFTPLAGAGFLATHHKRK